MYIYVPCCDNVRRAAAEPDARGAHATRSSPVGRRCILGNQHAFDADGTGYQFLRHPPPHPPPQLPEPRTSRMISNNNSAPIVALMIAATMPTPRCMPS
jgi:hypothetical protein